MQDFLWESPYKVASKIWLSVKTPKKTMTFFLANYFSQRAPDHIFLF